MVLVLTGDVSVIGSFVEDETPWMIETTTLNVNATRGTGVTVVAIDLVVVCTHDIQIPVVEHKTAGLTLDSTELLEESSSGSVIYENTVSTLTGHIKVVIQAEGSAPWTIQTTRPRLNKDIEEGTGVSIVTENAAGLEIRHVHGWEIGEAEGV